MVFKTTLLLPIAAIFALVAAVPFENTAEKFCPLGQTQCGIIGCSDEFWGCPILERAADTCPAETVACYIGNSFIGCKPKHLGCPPDIVLKREAAICPAGLKRCPNGGCFPGSFPCPKLKRQDEQCPNGTSECDILSCYTDNTHSCPPTEKHCPTGFVRCGSMGCFPERTGCPMWKREIDPAHHVGLSCPAGTLSCGFADHCFTHCPTLAETEKRSIDPAHRVGKPCPAGTQACGFADRCFESCPMEPAKRGEDPAHVVGKPCPLGTQSCGFTNKCFKSCPMEPVSGEGLHCQPDSPHCNGGNWGP